MRRTSQFIKALCHHGTVLALTALTASTLTTTAAAGTSIPQKSATVKFDSESGQANTTIILEATNAGSIIQNDLTFWFRDSGGDSVYCNGIGTKFINREVVFDNDGKPNIPGQEDPPGPTNRNISHKGIDVYNSDNSRFEIPITLCREGIGSTFEVSWESSTTTPFDASASHCTSSSACTTTVTILAEDPPVATLALSPTSISEGGGSSVSTVTASLDKAAHQDVTLTVSASPVSPAVAGDFTLSQNTTLTIPAGQKASTGAVTIAAVDNSLDAATDKTITVSASASGGGVADPADATLTITDDDTLAWSLAVSPPAIAENGGTSTVTVSTGGVTFAADKKITLALTGTATKGADYTIGSESQKLTLTAGQASVTTTVTGVDDSVDDDAETVIITASENGSTVGAAQITITDDDGATTITNDDCVPASLLADVKGYVAEGGNQQHVDRWKKVLRAFGEDNIYTPMTAVDARINSKIYSPSRWNPVVEALTCLENKAGPSISITGGDPVTEGGTAVFTISASKAPAADLVVSLTVSQSGDFVASGDLGSQKTVTITTGSKSATYSVGTVGDGTDEPDGSVVVRVDSGTDYKVGSPSSATVTVNDDDGTTSSSAVLSISAPAGADELDSSTQDRYFTVSLSQAPSADVDWKVCLSGTATADLSQGQTIPGGYDYQPISGTSAESSKCFSGTFQPTGSLSDNQIGIRVKGDSDPEEDESVTAMLSMVGTPPSDVTLGSPHAVTHWIYDDDATSSHPVVTISGGSAVTEGVPASFTVNANPAPAANLTVNLSVSEDTTNGQDFVAASDEGGSKTVVINAGQASATYTVGTVDDGTDETDGSVTVRVNSGGGYTVGGGASATVTVNDDDGTTTPSSGEDRSFSIDDVTAMEKDEAMTFTVRLSAATVGNSQASVRVTSRDGTAISGLDYQAVNKLVVFQAGQTSKEVEVTIIDDAHNEGTETFEMVLSDPVNGAIGDGTATGTINNTDYVPQSELAHFGRSVANHVLEGVIGRITSPRSPGATATIAGNVIPRTDRAPGADCSNCGYPSTGRQVTRIDGDQILADSSFVLNGQDDSSHSPAFWGRGTRSYFSDRPGSLSIDGKVTSFMLGADLGWSDKRIIGLALIRSSGKIDHMERPGTENPNTGQTDLTLTALVPYAGWKISDRVDVWGALGHGNGKMTLDLNAGDTSEEIRTSFDWTMAAAGLRGELASPGPDGGPRLTALLDAYRVRTSSKATEGLAASKSSVTRLRAGLEASWEILLEGGAVLVPRMETNLIQETGDLGSGFGLELAGGLSWANPDLGLTLDLSARRLRSHDSPGRKDHGYSMALVYDPNPESDRGLSVSMRQESGNPESTVGGNLTSALPETVVEDSSTQWTTELAYGLPVIDGSFTGSPHAGIEDTDDYRDYTLGWRLTPAGRQAPDISFDINATRREGTFSGTGDHRLGIGLVAEW